MIKQKAGQLTRLLPSTTARQGQIGPPRRPSCTTDNSAMPITLINRDCSASLADVRFALESGQMDGRFGMSALCRLCCKTILGI
jgi:hypothetical protein